MADIRRRKVNAEQHPQNAQDMQSKDNEGTLSPLIAMLSNIWFFGLCLAVCILTETYYEFLIAFGIHYVVFLCHAFPLQSEKFYDFTGMITFIAVDVFSYCYRQQSVHHVRNTLLSLMVLCWTLRLGLFLFWRILQHNGSDSRFDSFRGVFWNFLMVWTMSAQWVYFCTLPLIIVNKVGSDSNLYLFDGIGWTLFAVGWVIEIVADAQKTRFKADASNKGKFIRTGLWKLSRHPNYFGEILLWLGIATSACSVVQRKFDYLVLLSPFWTFMLLVFMSGIPPSEKTFKRKYKDVDGFQEYMRSTPVLVPFCFCWR